MKKPKPCDGYQISKATNAVLNVQMPAMLKSDQVKTGYAEFKTVPAKTPAPMIPPSDASRRTTFLCLFR